MIVVDSNIITARNLLEREHNKNDITSPGSIII